MNHLVISENQLADVKQLVHFGTNYWVKQLEVAENPVVAEKADAFKMELLLAIGETRAQIRKIGEEDVTPEDYAAAVAERAARIKAEEDARREAAEKAAAGEAPNAEEAAE